ncbi:MAG: SDR family oxidoreductase [Lachnospiraceae bacterium]|nr:SDR family oxidoreductase [Lachnospiraceae bacterium]
MKVLITGTSSGIGKACAERFLLEGHEVIGIDRLPASIDHPAYRHFTADIREADALPEIENVEILVNNAGVQGSGDDISVNLRGTIAVTEKYIAGNPALKSVLFNASASAVSGQEFPEYAASKAGLLGYMRNVAIRMAPRGATCNAVSLGGVLTASNNPVMNDPVLWEKIMAVTPLKRWMTEEEAASWVYFLTVTNRSMSGQNVLIDNGEKDLNPTFVWPEE